MQSVSAPREPTQPVINTSSAILTMREKEKYIEDFDFPFCDESSKYEKVAKIGQGTFGEVFKARARNSSKKFVAMKKVLMDNEKEGFPITALREIRILQLLKHENVVNLIEICRTKATLHNKYRSTFYLVFDFCEHDLAGLLSNVNVKFSLGEIKKVMQQLLNGLYYIHSNKILHRDMKAANVLITKNGILKLADFGLARAFSVAKSGQVNKYTNRVVTLWYRPPELLLGDRNYGPPVDIWGAGCIMAEMWTRSPIMQGPTEQQQLILISQLCGSCTPDVWPGVENLDLYNKMELPKGQKRKVKERLKPYVKDPYGCDLLDKLLQLDPAKSWFPDRVAKHPILTHSEDFRIFLTTPDDELEKVFKSENSALNLWGLSSAIYGSGETKNANGPRVKDPEFTSAADYLQSLQQKLTTLCTLTVKLHKNTDSLGHELLGMKRACDAWAAGARRGAARAVAGCGAGAAHAACARGRAPLAARAVLPLLAQYAAAHVDKIRQRDAVHAAYVSGANNSDEVHNRLEQASEALRSELSDWVPKTHAEIKSLLLDLAERQVNIHTQTLLGWEHALKQATEPNVEDIFKTVSKTAVQNLSPSRCKAEMSPTETERDLDDYSDYNDDLESHDSDQLRNLNDDSIEKTEAKLDIECDGDVNNDIKVNDDIGDKRDNKVDYDVNVDISANDNQVTEVMTVNKNEEDVFSEILEEELPSGSEKKINRDKIKDPLTEFTDVDLS